MSTISTRRRLAGAALATAALALGACSRVQEQPKVPLSQAVEGSAASTQQNPHDALAPEARTALDAGNAAFRAGKLDDALTQYRLAAKAEPDNAAPYYGIYMVAQKKGDKKLMETAMADVQAHSKGSKMLTDSSMAKVHTK